MELELRRSDLNRHRGRSVPEREGGDGLLCAAHSGSSQDQGERTDRCLRGCQRLEQRWVTLGIPCPCLLAVRYGGGGGEQHGPQVPRLLTPDSDP